MALCGASHQLAVISGNGQQRTAQLRRIKRSFIKAQASTSSEVSVFEEGRLERPNWSGQTPLSRLVGALISFKPLYSILKLGARQVFIRSTLCVCVYTYEHFFWWNWFRLCLFLAVGCDVVLVCEFEQYSGEEEYSMAKNNFWYFGVWRLQGAWKRSKSLHCLSWLLVPDFSLGILMH